MKIQKIAGLVCRLVAAAILLQTLYFKFTAHPESVALFTKLGAEPWGRIGTGVLELVASVFLLIRPSVLPGALMAAGLMVGAIGSHIFVIGIESAGDGGQLFMLAFVVLFCSLVVLILYRQDIKKFGFIPEFFKRMV